MDDKTYRRMMLSCQCGKSFRSYAAEAFHRHNFPIMCKLKKARKMNPAYNVACVYCQAPIGRACSYINRKGEQAYVAPHLDRLKMSRGLMKEHLETLELMARKTKGAFAKACRDPNISKEDYDKLKAQYEAAMLRNHQAQGY